MKHVAVYSYMTGRMRENSPETTLKKLYTALKEAGFVCDSSDMSFARSKEIEFVIMIEEAK